MTTFKTAFFIAYKSIIKGNKSTLLLLIFILTLSYINLMFISGILNGLGHGITEAMIDTSLGHITLKPQEKPTEKEFINNERELRAKISTIPGVVGVTKHYTIGGNISFDKDKDGKFKSTSANFVGIYPEEEKKVLNLEGFMVDGDFPNDLESDEIIVASGVSGGYVVGPEAGNNLGGAKAGDEVLVTYAGGIVRQYKIRGIFDVSMGTLTSSVFISAKEAESILSTYNSASELVIKVDDQRDTLENYYARISAMAPNLKIQTYKDLMETMNTILSAFDLISYIVSAISVAVAAVTIFVLIYVNAINKRRQIGILKAIGIKENVIELSYVFQSVFYAVCSILVGAVIVFGVLSPFVAAHPIDLSFGYGRLVFTQVNILVGIISLLVAGLAAGYIPARMISKESILKAIWG